MPNPFAQPAYSAHYPRDLVGYGAQPPQANWPGKAKIALQFVLNYEEGAENTVLDGDAGSERFLSEIVGAESYRARHMSMESIYEYGSRAGAWRILREFERRKLPLTVFGVTLALKRHPELTAALLEQKHEIASHGLRWLHYQGIDEATELAGYCGAAGLVLRPAKAGLAFCSRVPIVVLIWNMPPPMSSSFEL